MTRYVALLRGIMPMNSNMRSEKLRGAFEAMGFKNVATVIGSGNVVFDSPSKSSSAIESKIEKALPKLLGFSSTTIVRSKKELEELVQKDPFKNIGTEAHHYTIVTFLKRAQTSKRPLPYQGAGYQILSMHDRVIASVIDRRHTSTPDIMRVFEKEFSKDITTRTWQTVGKILKKM